MMLSCYLYLVILVRLSPSVSVSVSVLQSRRESKRVAEREWGKKGKVLSQLVFTLVGLCLLGLFV